MREVLNYLLDHKTLSKESAKQLLVDIGQGKVNNSQTAAFLTVYMMRNITVEELEGFRDAMLELCVQVDLSAYDPMDLCGTGGDGKDTFNISTIASFVTAGAGIKVAKHGNYGVSSPIGSSNIMEYFGYKFTNNISQLQLQLEKAGISFLHAPLFHPAMKNVAPIRKEIGSKTFFNMLGPMVNPSRPKTQVVGVFNLELARLYNYLYQKSGKKYTIVYSLDGYDEISLTGPFKLISTNSEKIMSPKELGLERVTAGDLHSGNTLQDSGQIFMNVLENTATKPQTETVLANAAVAIACKQQVSLNDALEIAKESLESGKALKSFKKLLALS